MAMCIMLAWDVGASNRSADQDDEGVCKCQEYSTGLDFTISNTHAVVVPFAQSVATTTLHQDFSWPGTAEGADEEDD